MGSNRLNLLLLFYMLLASFSHSFMHRTRRAFHQMLFLSESDVRKCLSMKDCIDVNRVALGSLREGGGAKVPSRLALPYYSGDSSSTAADWSLFKPAAHYGDHHIEMGLKIVSVRSENPSHGLPLVPATVLLMNAATGMVEAMMGGTYLTGARTAAGSAVATDVVCHMTRREPKNLVIFGAGLQCECHIEALLCVQPSISKITIINRSRERAEKVLQEKLGAGLHGKVVLLSDKQQIEQVLSDADVVVTCTNTATRLFDGSWLKPGCHVNGIGSYTPDMQEVDIATVSRSKVIVDTPEAIQVGDLKHLQDDKESQTVSLLADVMKDPAWITPSTEREGAMDCTFYKGVGTAIQDVMTAALVAKRARELGLGTNVDMP